MATTDPRTPAAQITESSPVRITRRQPRNAGRGQSASGGVRPVRVLVRWQTEEGAMRLKLTEKKIAAIKAAGEAFEILHEKTPGAGLRVSSLGAKIWFYMYRSPVRRNDPGRGATAASLPWLSFLRPRARHPARRKSPRHHELEGVRTRVRRFSGRAGERHRSSDRGCRVRTSSERRSRECLMKLFWLFARWRRGQPINLPHHR
jgi:hypothetical protein